MENSKLSQMLNKLSKEELRAMAKFAELPMFNPRPEAVALLRYLSARIGAGKPLPKKEVAFKHLFPEADYDDQKMRLAMTALSKAIEKYWALNDFFADRPSYQIRLCKVLRSKNLPDQARAAWQNGYAALEGREWRNAGYCYEKHLYEEEKYRVSLDSSEAAAADLQQLSDTLDASLLSHKLSQACTLLAHQARYTTLCDFGVLEGLLPSVEKFRGLPSVSVYWSCYRALVSPKEPALFKAFKDELAAHEVCFPAEELRDLYVLAINFCTRRYNEGDHSFQREQFELYRIGFEKHYFLTEGVLSRFTYLNAATIGIVLQELAWVEDFIETYRDALEPQSRESLHAFNMARLKYHNKQYGAALQLLQKAEYKETMLALAAKTIQLKIYYETEEHDLLESHLQAIGAFLRRKKVMGYHRENYQNLLQLVRRLMELNPMDKKAKSAFLHTVESTKPLAEKEWLLAQV